MCILEHHQYRPRAGQTFKLAEQCRQRPLALGLWRQSQCWVSPIRRDDSSAAISGATAETSVEAVASKLSSLSSRRSVGSSWAKPAARSICSMTGWNGLLICSGEQRQWMLACVSDLQPVDQCAHEPRLADPRFAGQQHNLAGAILRSLPEREQPGEFALSSDQRHRAAYLPRLEPALGAAAADHPPCLERLLKARDRPPAEVDTIEQATDQLARAVRDHHGARLGHGLKPSGEVGRGADGRMLAGRAAADQVTHHDETGGDTDAHPQRQAVRRPDRAGRRR